jgi:hypothetical protein
MCSDAAPHRHRWHIARGLRAAAALRDRGFDGELTVIGDDTSPLRWSDQYDCRIQFIGGGPPHDEIVIVDGRSPPKTDGALRRGDRLVACLAFNQPRALIK